MSDEQNGTSTELDGADNAITNDTATDANESGITVDQENPDTGKTYTQAEVDAQNAKTRKATERKVRREIEREIASKQAIAPPKVEIEPPKRENYKSDAEYDDARLDYRIEVKEAKAESAKAARQMEEAYQDFVEKTDELYEAAEELPGFDRDDFNDLYEQVKPSIEFSVALAESDKGAQIMEYLTMNEAEFLKLKGLSPARQAAAIGTIEARLTKQTKSAGDQTVQVKGGGLSTSTMYKTDPGKLTDEQWYNERKAERERQYRR